MVNDLTFSWAVEGVEGAVAAGLICEQLNDTAQLVVLILFVNLREECVIGTAHFLPESAVQRFSDKCSTLL
jgi:hypothetical protein